MATLDRQHSMSPERLMKECFTSVHATQPHTLLLVVQRLFVENGFRRLRVLLIPLHTRTKNRTRLPNVRCAGCPAV